MSDKFFVGGKLRRIRSTLSLSQTQMSEEIGISTSYLNLLESNQRPLSISVLMKINDRFDIDVKELTSDNSPEMTSQIKRVLADPINIDTPMSRREINDFVNNFPNAAQSLINVFDRYGKIHEQLSFKKFNEKHKGLVGNPFEVLATIFTVNSESLYKVETSAESFLMRLFGDDELKPKKVDYRSDNTVPNILTQLIYFADTELNLRVRFIPSKVLGKSARLYDPHKGEILINESESNFGKQFHLLVEVGLIFQQKLFDDIVRDGEIKEIQNNAAFKIALAGYFAGAVLRPKTPFVSKRETKVRLNSESASNMAFYFSAGFAALGNKSNQTIL